MPKTQKRKPLFERIKQGLEEGIAFCKGEIELRTTIIPDSPPPITPQQIVSLRDDLKVTQIVMAHVLNVSPRTLQSWENGSRTPSQTSLRLLQIVRQHPEIVAQVVGLEEKPKSRKSIGRASSRRQLTS